MAIAKFLDEIGTDLNKFQVTTSSGETYEITLLRKANISQVGTLLNASKLNELVDGINANTTSISNLSTVARTGSYTDLSNKPTSLPASDVYSWAKSSTKPTYTASEVGTYTTTEIDTKLGTKQNTIDSNNKLSYTLLKDTPTKLSEFTNDTGFPTGTIPTKLSQLENDAMYLKNSSNWEGGAVWEYVLRSEGFYYVEFTNDKEFASKRISAGIICYSGVETYYPLRYGSTVCALIVAINGEMTIKINQSGAYTGTLQEKPRFFWKKLG